MRQQRAWRRRLQVRGSDHERQGPQLDQLRGSILRAAAQRELALREAESFLPRPVHPELAIFKSSDVEC